MFRVEGKSIQGKANRVEGKEKKTWLYNKPWLGKAEYPL